jgi:hypothetical protein
MSLAASSINPQFSGNDGSIEQQPTGRLGIGKVKTPLGIATSSGRAGESSAMLESGGMMGWNTVWDQGRKKQVVAKKGPTDCTKE